MTNAFTTANFFTPAKRNDVLMEDLSRVVSNVNEDSGDPTGTDASGDVKNHIVTPSAASTGKPAWTAGCTTVTPGDIHK